MIQNDPQKQNKLSRISSIAQANLNTLLCSSVVSPPMKTVREIAAFVPENFHGLSCITVLCLSVFLWHSCTNANNLGGNSNRCRTTRPRRRFLNRTACATNDGASRQILHFADRLCGIQKVDAFGGNYNGTFLVNKRNRS